MNKPSLQEGKLHTKGKENIFKIIREGISPNLWKEEPNCIEEAYGIPSRQDQKRNSNVLKSLNEKHQVTCEGRPIKITVRLSMETFKARRAWNDILSSSEGSQL